MNSESRGELISHRAPSEPVSAWYSDELGPEERPHLRDYWRTLVKHRYSAIATFLVCVVGTAAYTFTREPLYTAASTLQIVVVTILIILAQRFSRARLVF